LKGAFVGARELLDEIARIHFVVPEELIERAISSFVADFKRVHDRAPELRPYSG